MDLDINRVKKVVKTKKRSTKRFKKNRTKNILDEVIKDLDILSPITPTTPMTPKTPKTPLTPITPLPPSPPITPLTPSPPSTQQTTKVDSISLGLIPDSNQNNYSPESLLTGTSEMIDSIFENPVDINNITGNPGSNNISPSPSFDWVNYNTPTYVNTSFEKGDSPILGETQLFSDENNFNVENSNFDFNDIENVLNEPISTSKLSFFIN